MKQTTPLIVLGLLAAVLFAASSTSLTPVAQAAGCPPPPPSSTPFTSWGDNSSYVLATGGSFDLGTGGPAGPGQPTPTSTPWSLTGGAAIVNDNDPWNLSHSPSKGALSLPSGSSALSGCTSAPMIKSIVRFIVKNTGASTGQLHVAILVNGGKNGTLDGGTITAGTSWAPSPQIVIPWAHPLSGAVDLQVELTPVGTGASFEVDDVYIDPYCSK